ncbi:MAG: DUF3109 family protein, partial [Flavobacteriales bacterium]
SEELLKDEFVCNLSACKGACCIEGEGGAPLTKEEHFLLEEQWDKLKPYLSEISVRAIETQGFGVIGLDGELETPLINGAECVYVTRKEDGSLACGIEQANNDGKIDFMKPESCHLYPIRVQQLPTFESLLYHKWDICSPACALGAELKVPVYKFLKQALTRKYGADWYAELERIADEYRASIGLNRLKHD